MAAIIFPTDPARLDYVATPWADPLGKQWTYEVAKDRWNPYLSSSAPSGGASAFADLTDKTTADLPAINGPLATALAGKSSSGHTHDYSGVYQSLNGRLTSISGLTYTGNQLKVLRVNAAESAFELVSIFIGGGDALVANSLDQFADVTQTPGATFAITGNASITGTNTGDQDLSALTAHAASTANPHSVTKSQVGLGSVENTALSTWTGTANITTLGTIATGTWQGSIIAPAYLGSGTSISTKYLRGDGTWQTLSGGGDAATSGTLDQFADVTQTAGQTLSITSSTTLAGGSHSGTNTGDNAVNSNYSGLVSNATHTGDATGSTALTLATVNSNVGAFGSATAAVTLTVNGKGLITAASATTITPAIGSITGLGTGIATALAIATGSAGAPVLFNGALGTPASGVLSSCTGLREPWVFLLSGPLVTDVATTGRKAWFRVTQACTLAAADVSVDAVTAPTVTAFTADIEKNGTSIYSTRPAIDVTEISSSTGVQGTMTTDPTSFAVGDIVGIWVDIIGSTGAGFSLTAGFKF